MKRGAEKQLTKDDGHDDGDIEEIQPETEGFQKADESTLAKRQIRALPKRALKPSTLNGLPSAPALNADKVEAISQPKFGTFSGFGAGPSASNPFNFTAQPSAIAVSSVSDTTQSATTPNPSVVAPPLGPAKPSTSDPNATLPESATSSPAEETNAVALKYFKSLRGLNVSFLSAISTAVEKDPFCDVAALIESYRNLRTTIQSEFDTSSRPSTVPTPLFGAKAPPEKEKVTPFTMPKPPAGFAATSAKPPSTGENDGKSGGFTFPPFVPPSSSAPTQLPFGLTSKSSESPGFGAPSTSTSKSNQPPTSEFSFTSSSTIESTMSKSISGPTGKETEGSSTDSSPQPSSTPSSFASGSVPNFFATSRPLSAFGASDTSKPTSVFGSSVFGNGSTTEPSKSSPFNLVPSDSKDNSKVTPSPFGNVTASSSTPTSVFGSSSDTSASPFGTASPSKTNAFTFGKPAGSIGNPVGFGFGSSPSSGDTTVGSSSGFTFGAPSTKASESLFSPPATDRSTESTPQPEAEGDEEGGEDGAVKSSPSRTHDGEGEGEEHEETTHAVRCRVYRLSKSEDKSEWKDLGVGMLRLKKHKETHARRILMRNSNTGRILVNFRIYESLKPSLAKTSISFIGYENSAPTSFTVRVKTEEQAAGLQQALEREIAAVQAAE